ncbi:MAG: hypothetical protein PHU28_05930, partial [Methanosarcinaceae archaeon]|nr:hypothetical protein [Methanosarcinaceae archaeon]
MDKKIIRYLSSADEMVIPFSVFYAFLINSLSNILSDKVGDFLNSIICILFLCIGMIVLIFREKRKEKNIQKRIDSSIESRKLKSKYKGLITFVSEAKLNEQNENDYFEKCKHIIEDYKQTQNVNEIAKIRGI